MCKYEIFVHMRDLLRTNIHTVDKYWDYNIQNTIDTDLRTVGLLILLGRSIHSVNNSLFLKRDEWYKK